MDRPNLGNPLDEEHDRSRVHALIIIRGVFIVMLATVVMLSLLRGGAGTGERDPTEALFIAYWWVPLLVALFLGAAAITLDALTPHKKLSGMTGALFGLIAGLLATVAITWILDLLLEAHGITFPADSAGNRIIIAIKAAFGITLCYLGVSVVYSTQDEFRLIIPYVEFSKQLRGTRPLLLDTSAIIDGRIHDMGQTGFLSAPVIIPKFVIDELQTLSDSSDRLKRNRGRRGLDMVRKLQGSPHLDLSIIDLQAPGLGVDQMLLELAREHRAHLVTTDFNLNKVAAIHGVRVLNVNDLANALRPAAVPGEQLSVEIVKRGEARGQGVGYLDDGTMVVVENAIEHIGERVSLTVTSAIQTSAGRMIFGDYLDGAETPTYEEDGQSPPRESDGEGASEPATVGAAPASSSAASSARNSDDPDATRPPATPLHRPPRGRNPRRG